jgi:hypothetical protein
MTEAEEARIRDLQDQWDMLCQEARLIAMMPIEKWLEDLDHAETVGPFIDPTLMRDYLYSGKGEVLKKVMRAALHLKKAVNEVQPYLAALRARTEGE